MTHKAPGGFYVDPVGTSVLSLMLKGTKRSIEARARALDMSLGNGLEAHSPYPQKLRAFLDSPSAQQPLQKLIQLGWVHMHCAQGRLRLEYPNYPTSDSGALRRTLEESRPYLSELLMAIERHFGHCDPKLLERPERARRIANHQATGLATGLLFVRAPVASIVAWTHFKPLQLWPGFFVCLGIALIDGIFVRPRIRAGLRAAFV